MHIDILGTPYNIKFATSKEYPKFDVRDADGLAELYSKELYIRTGYEDDPNCFNDITKYREKVIRHELFHAIFHECGLDNYSDDEQLVNFLALQWYKIVDIMNKAKDIHNEVIEGNKQYLKVNDEGLARLAGIAQQGIEEQLHRKVYNPGGDV